MREDEAHRTRSVAGYRQRAGRVEDVGPCLVEYQVPIILFDFSAELAWRS